jgi:hypothetical protein
MLVADVERPVTPNPTHTFRLAATLIGVTLLVTCCANPDDRPSEPVSRDGWSARQMVCGYRETDDPLATLGAEQVLALGEEGAALLAAADCVDGNGSDRSSAPPPLDEDRSYFAFNTGADRFDATLVSVDTSVEPTRLGTELTVVGEGCGTTDDYRGQLMLLIEAPAGAAVPDVSMREVPLSC